MQLSSLGLKSDLAPHTYSARIISYPDCLQVVTSSAPDFFWGNYLVFPGPPSSADVAAWPRRFDDLFRDTPGIEHRSFTWDRPLGTPALSSGLVEAFAAAGYEYGTTIFLVGTPADAVLPIAIDPVVTVRPICDTDDWLAVLEMQSLCRELSLDADRYRAFIEKRIAIWRRHVDANAGAWFGAFIEGRLVADAGIFWNEELARFQNVETHPDYRRRGICSRLIYEICQFIAVTRPQVHLVMEADPDYHAARIYERLGFRAFYGAESLCIYDKALWEQSS